MRELNSALVEESSPSRKVLFSKLDIKTLHTEETTKCVEQWAQNMNPSPEALPWWAKPPTAAAIDAYEELDRVAERSSRIAAERASALAWIERRLVELRAAPKDMVYAEAIEGLEHLRQHWAADIDLSDALHPDECMMAVYALHATPDDADAASMELKDV
ncbi:hypothetical protein CF319_g4528 [Tilletia indica]|nr:hypothetical protein CF319_g4528 [Tilletia indica]